MLTRNKFIQQALAISAGGALMGHSPIEDAWLCGYSDDAVDTIVFDFHAHPGRFYARGTDKYQGDEGLMKTVTEMNTGGLSGAFFSLVVDTLITKVTETGVVPARAFNPKEAWGEYKRQLHELKDLCSRVPMRCATKVSELTDRKQQKAAAFIACEGGDFLESADQLDELYADGVRAVQLVHYAPNPLGDLQTYESQHNGLSKLGKSVVRKMNSLGMVIDVAHASFKTVKDVAEYTDAPFILSHSILKVNEDRPIAMRAITSEHAKLVAAGGGVIGAWPSGFNKSFDDYINNIVRLIELVGADHVGLGTDMDSNFKPVLDSYLQLSKWTDALKARGLSDEEVRKVAGGNAVRVMQRVFK